MEMSAPCQHVPWTKKTRGETILAVFTWTEVDNVCPRSISPSWTLTTLIGCENCRGICEPDGSGPEISRVRHVTSMSIHLQRSDRVLIIFSQPSGMPFNVRALIVSQCSFLMTDGLGGRRASVTQLWICKKKLRDSRGHDVVKLILFVHHTHPWILIS